MFCFGMGVLGVLWGFFKISTLLHVYVRVGKVRKMPLAFRLDGEEVCDGLLFLEEFILQPCTNTKKALPLRQALLIWYKVPYARGVELSTSVFVQLFLSVF